MKLVQLMHTTGIFLTIVFVEIIIIYFKIININLRQFLRVNMTTLFNEQAPNF